MPTDRSPSRAFIRRLARLGALFWALTLTFGASAAAAGNVGFRMLQLPDPQGAPIEVGVWYPTDAPVGPSSVGPMTQTVARDAPVVGRGLPLVVVSHGNGGWFASHHDTAMALAEAGFVVAALTHTGDNWRDQSRATDMADRPRQLHLLIDHMLARSPLASALDAGRVGAFGFSSGGFTVLAAAGGEPDLGLIAPHCQAHPTFFDCRLTATHGAPARREPVVWVHDTRIRAVVSAAPALGFTFTPHGLAGVTQPLQLWRAAEDEILPHPFYAEAVRLALPRPPEHHVVEGARHFDFLPPCSAEFAAVAPAICTPAPDFDRAAFHAAFNAEVVRFFKAEL